MIKAFAYETACCQKNSGRLFIEFAVAVSVSVIISAFVALTLSPAIAARVLKPIQVKKATGLFGVFEAILDAVTRGYLSSLRWALRHRFLSVLVTLGTVALMIFAYRGLDKDFLPQEDKSRMFAVVLTPNGSTSEFTDRQLRKAEAIIASVPVPGTLPLLSVAIFGWLTFKRRDSVK